MGRRSILAALVALAGCHGSSLPPSGCGDLPATVPARPFAIVGDRVSDRLELYALAPSLSRVGCWSVDENPDFIDEPFDLAVAPAGDVVYVVLGHPAAYAKGTLLKLRVSDGAHLGEVALGEEPSMIALSSDGSRAYVTLFKNLAHPRGPWTDPGALVVVDTASMRVLDTVTVCAAALGVALDEPRQRVWVACLGGDALAVVDVSGAPRLDRMVPLVDASGPGSGPAYLALAGGHVFVSAQGSGDLWAFDAATAATIARIPFGSDSFPQRLEVSADGSRVYLALDGAQRIAEIASTAVLLASQTALPGVHPQGLAIDRAGAFLLITDENDLQNPGRLVRLALTGAAANTTATAPSAIFPQAVRIVY